MSKKQLLIDSLKKMKEELDKRNNLIDYGIDLANYENLYLTVCLDVTSHMLSEIITEKSIESCLDDIQWWLFEDVKKEFYFQDKVFNVEKPEDFINFFIEFWTAPQS